MSAAITPEVLAQHRIAPGEYERILAILGREPSPTELGIFSVMWSEHCSYKNSKPLLKLLPTQAPHVLQGPGENAGVVDFGDGLAVCFKMESHNHPSAVEPYQGAATGVGGILRDIFTMGARPVALVDCLFFGEPGTPENDRIIGGVVRGIADYGNCVGVPTVAGSVCFSPAYAGNPLVNAMAVGVMRREDLTLARARETGSLVVYYGNATGRDGVHGATFASGELNEEALERRGAVQVGDPFAEKKILEATLELIRAGVVEAIQDMGAAGLTCSGCEIAGRGRLGMELDLDCVPQRAQDMSAYEMMLSESQERMLAVVAPANLGATLEILEKWETNPAVVGRVMADGMLTVRHRGETVACVPALAISEESPVYAREAKAPAAGAEAYAPGAWAENLDAKAALLEVLAHPTIASKRWIHRQFDTQVQTNTVLGPGAGAAVLRVDGSERLLAISCGVDPLKVAINPYLGGMMAVAEAANNLLCVGARPLGLTDNLNFGNPEKPEQFWYLKRAVEGIADAARALAIPVTGGNVSLYNESPTGPIWPTPTIGMVGVIDDRARLLAPGFKTPGDVIVAFGALPSDYSGSWLAWLRDGKLPGPIENECYAETATRLASLMHFLIGASMLTSAADATEGGLAVAVAEGCLFAPSPVGAEIAFDEEDGMPLMFGETGALIVGTVPQAMLKEFRELMETPAYVELDFVELGEVVSSADVTWHTGGESVVWSLDELRKARGG